MKQLHTDKDGRLFFRKEGWPEKPDYMRISQYSDLKERAYSDYQQALSKAFEDAVPVEYNTECRMAIWHSSTGGYVHIHDWKIKPLTAYDLPEGYRVNVEDGKGYLVPAIYVPEVENKKASRKAYDEFVKKHAEKKQDECYKHCGNTRAVVDGSGVRICINCGSGIIEKEPGGETQEELWTELRRKLIIRTGWTEIEKLYSITRKK